MWSLTYLVLSSVDLGKIIKAADATSFPHHRFFCSDKTARAQWKSGSLGIKVDAL